MALEDFERELAKEQADRQKKKRSRSRSPERDGHRSSHRQRSPRTHKSDSRHHERRAHKHRRTRHGDDDGESRRHRDRRDKQHRSSRQSPGNDGDDTDIAPDLSAPTLPEEDILDARIDDPDLDKPKRDSWMQAPSALDVDVVQRKQRKSPPAHYVKSTAHDQPLKLHENELNRNVGGLQGQSADSVPEDTTTKPRSVNYTFGDAGSTWRMTKLKGVYRKAEQTETSLDSIALEIYGNLEDFDDAREEETELERRQTYGKGYVGKTKPSGELYLERTFKDGDSRPAQTNAVDDQSDDEFETTRATRIQEHEHPAAAVALDQSALNKLKAQATKARLMKAPNAAKLEEEYNDAVQAASKGGANVVVLNKMESRLLAGSREGEVKRIDNKRGRERGLVEENEDMTVEDMVKQERRTKGQYGGDAKAYAERIAKDTKYDNDMDYMDDNAQKLAKSVQKSEINLRNTAIGDYHKMKRILDTCPLCHHEDSGKPPQAPIVSLGTRTFMTLPTSPEITPYGLCASIVPIQHRFNLLECDDDEWEEIRNFMKSLSRFYWSQKPRYHVIFYENAAHEGRKRHASMEAIPLPASLAENASAFFKEAILAADEEWTQHKKVIDTLHNAQERGMGKLAFRRSMVSELPYFHVWFSLDGGLGHVVEDTRRWPKGDLFAREIIGGMLDVGPEVIKRQGRWRADDPELRKRVRDFRGRRWESEFDWTKALLEA